MGTETYAKNGQVSKKAHWTNAKQGKEMYKSNRLEPNPSLGGAPEAFERKYEREYRKTSLPHKYPEEPGEGMD